MEPKPAPRIYCITATEAPVAAVLCRGPSAWSHVGRWDLARRSYDPGAWLRGRIFPRRSDLSPDGRFLCYFAHAPTASWEHGDAYVALSRLPWLTALHAFATCGTWTRGYCFGDAGERPDAEHASLPIPHRLRSIPVIQFATERRRGWTESADSPARDAGDLWDERRNARMEKRQPGGSRVLHVESVGAAGGGFGVAGAIDGLRVRYSLEGEGRLDALDDLQWADWDAEGRLIAATRSGRLQIRSLGDDGPTVLFEEDLSVLAPDPQPAPAWATRW